MQLFRLLKIKFIALRYGLDEFILSHARFRVLSVIINTLLFWRSLKQPRAVRLRLALESLGPIFIKFGQILSTRRDLIPPDIAEELSKLQDRVPPFDSALALAVIHQTYHKPAHEVFLEFDATPIASASVAQVHFAVLPDGTPVAVKILRPGIAKVIAQDVALMDTVAWLLEKLWYDGKRLKPREVVAEFSRHLDEELDLMLEAANCSLLHRNFADGRLLLVPEVYWDWCDTQVMVMQRMDGIPVSQVDRLRELGVDIPKLARDGVEIFFTQVFRDGFFHADMHPGNVQVGYLGDELGRYVALDFGIMGTLSDSDKQYLARNFLGFFAAIIRKLPERISNPAGCRPTPLRRFRECHPRSMRTHIRQAAERHLIRPCAVTAVPDLASFRHGDTTAIGDVAKKPCSISKAWGVSSTRIWIYGQPPNRILSAGCPRKWAGVVH